MRACPACGEELLPIWAPNELPHRGIVRWHVIGCPGCGGVWTDNDASQRVVGALDPKIIAAAEEAEGHAARAGGPLPDDSKPRVCPECGGALERARAAGTHLDACAKHGTWFDRGELRKVAFALEHQRKLKDPSWTSSEDLRWVSGKTALNEGAPPPYRTEDQDDLLGSGPSTRADFVTEDLDDLLVEAIAWAARAALRKLK